MSEDAHVWETEAAVIIKGGLAKNSREGEAWPPTTSLPSQLLIPQWTAPMLFSPTAMLHVTRARAHTKADFSVFRHRCVLLFDNFFFNG